MTIYFNAFCIIQLFYMPNRNLAVLVLKAGPIPSVVIMFLLSGHQMAVYV